MGAINDMVMAFGGWMNLGLLLTAIWIVGSVTVGISGKYFHFGGEKRWKVPFFIIFILILGTPFGVAEGVGQVFSAIRAVGAWLNRPVGDDL